MSKFDTHGGFFSPKDYTRVNVGGSHEENPYGGVQLGVDPEGAPNLLEEGEPVYKDYVYSDNIVAERDVLEQFNLPVKYAGKLYSKIADDFVTEAEERPLDPISRSGLEAMLGRLAEAQEAQKQAEQQRELEEELANLSPEELDELEMMLAQQEQMPQEQMVPERQMQPEMMAPEQMAMQQPVEGMPMMRCGGKIARRFDDGGDIPPAGSFILDPETGRGYTVGDMIPMRIDNDGNLIDYIEPSVVTAALPAKFHGSQDAARRYAEGYQFGKKVSRGSTEFAKDFAPVLAGAFAAPAALYYGAPAAYALATNPFVQTAADAYFTVDGVNNALSDNGVAKTVRLAKEGDWWGAAKSGLVDALDLTGAYSFARKMAGAQKALMGVNSIMSGSATVASRLRESESALRSLGERMDALIKQEDAIIKEIDAAGGRMSAPSDLLKRYGELVKEKDALKKQIAPLRDEYARLHDEFLDSIGSDAERFVPVTTTDEPVTNGAKEISKTTERARKKYSKAESIIYDPQSTEGLLLKAHVDYDKSAEAAAKAKDASDKAKDIVERYKRVDRQRAEAGRVVDSQQPRLAKARERLEKTEQDIRDLVSSQARAIREGSSVYGFDVSLDNLMKVQKSRVGKVEQIADRIDHATQRLERRSKDLGELTKEYYDFGKSLGVDLPQLPMTTKTEAEIRNVFKTAFDPKWHYPGSSNPYPWITYLGLPAAGIGIGVHAFNKAYDDLEDPTGKAISSFDDDPRIITTLTPGGTFSTTRPSSQNDTISRVAIPRAEIEDVINHSHANDTIPYAPVVRSTIYNRVNGLDVPVANYARGGKINRFDNGGLEDFLKYVQSYKPSTFKGGIPKTYAIDRRFYFGPYKDIYDLENSDAYNNFTKYVLRNPDLFMDYFRALDDGTNHENGVPLLLDENGNLVSNWRDIYLDRRYDHDAGIYHLNPYDDYTNNLIASYLQRDRIIDPATHPIHASADLGFNVTTPSGSIVNTRAQSSDVTPTQADKINDGASDPNSTELNPDADGARGINILPTFPRYAGAIGAGLLGMYNAFQPADRYQLDRYNPVLPYGRIHLQNQVYNPVDQNMVANAQIAQGNATSRGLRNSGLGSSTAQAVLAADNNLTGNLGTGFLQTWDANNQRRNAVIAANNQAEGTRANFDYTVDQNRVGILNDKKFRDIQNQLMLQRLNYAAEGDKYNSISNQINAGLEALSGIGRENFSMNQINTNPAFIGYGLGPNGQMLYNPYYQYYLDNEAEKKAAAKSAAQPTSRPASKTVSRYSLNYNPVWNLDTSPLQSYGLNPFYGQNRQLGLMSKDVPWNPKNKR